MKKLRLNLVETLKICTDDMIIKWPSDIYHYVLIFKVALYQLTKIVVILLIPVNKMKRYARIAREQKTTKIVPLKLHI